MKTLKTVSLMSLALPLLASSLALASPGSDASDQINTVLSLTHDSIDRLMSEVKNANPASSNTADYELKRQDFVKRMTAVTDAYEAWLTDPATGLTARLKPLMDRYNHILAASQYDDSTKRDLLAAQWDQITSFSAQLTEDYHQGLQNLVAGVGFNPYANTDKWDAIAQQAYGFAEDHCLSQGCVIQSATDEVVYLVEVEKLFNRPLTFRLADSKVITILADKREVIVGSRSEEADCRYYKRKGAFDRREFNSGQFLGGLLSNPLSNIAAVGSAEGYTIWAYCEAAEISLHDYLKEEREYQNTLADARLHDPKRIHEDLDAYFRCSPTKQCGSESHPVMASHANFMARIRRLFSNVQGYPESFRELPIACSEDDLRQRK